MCTAVAISSAKVVQSLDDVPKTTDALVLSNAAVAFNVAKLAKSSKMPCIAFCISLFRLFLFF